MLRHEFQPGRLIVGVFLTASGIAYAGDAGGLWQTEWFAVIPAMVTGLVLAAVTASVTRAVRRRRRTTARPDAAP